MKQIIFKEDSKQRLDVFLLNNYDGISRSQIKGQIEKGKVLVNSKIVKAGYSLCEGDKVEFEDYVPEQLSAAPEDIKLNIIFENDNLAVINKPQGMVVHPSVGNKHGTLVNGLAFLFSNLSTNSGDFRPGIVHRLDKDTSGLLVIAKNNISHANLSKQIAEKTCKREYIALVEGIVKENEGTIITNIGRSKIDRKKMAVVPDGQGKIAITNFKVLERFENQSLLQFELKTGRTHQIRVHAKYMGHPVCADSVYGFKNSKIKNDGGQLLHAFRLSFTEPTTNEQLIFTAALPDYFEKILNKLRPLK